MAVHMGNPETEDSDRVPTETLCGKATFALPQGDRWTFTSARLVTCSVCKGTDVYREHAAHVPA